MLAWDTETYAIVPGCLTPPMVCLSLAWDTADPPPWLPPPGPDCIVTDRFDVPSQCQYVRGTALLGLDLGLAVAPHVLATDNVGANTSYDLAVLMAEQVDPRLIFD